MPNQDPDGAEESRSPDIAVDGFSGSLAHLLALARARQVDLAQLSLANVIDQLAGTLQATPVIPLSEKADWVVMAAWLVQLRSRLLLPIEAPARQTAATAADQLRGQLVELRTMQALADWLERRPQLGRDVFARGQPEIVGVSVDSGQDIDVIAFLWASLALFDDELVPDTANVYCPRPLALYDVAEARARILHRLLATPEGGSLDRFLPDPLDAGDTKAVAKVRRRSAWSSTLVACLELARQGKVVLEQVADLQPIHVGLAGGGSKLADESVTCNTPQATQPP